MNLQDLIKEILPCLVPPYYKNSITLLTTRRNTAAPGFLQSMQLSL